MDLRLLIILELVLQLVCVASLTTLKLHEVPHASPITMKDIRMNDLKRLSRLEIINFGVGGSADPLLGFGYYYTTIRLGTPPQEFNVRIYTGGDVSWVNCKPCNDCPESVNFETDFHYFDATKSPTASLFSCSDQLSCSSVNDHNTFGCSTPTNTCMYGLEYVDSWTQGYYISEVLTLDVYGGSPVSVSVTFGCSVRQPDFFKEQLKGIDGVLAFGLNKQSLVKQLSSLGVTRPIFGHCFPGNGTGHMIFGEIVAPTLTYSPLVNSGIQYHIQMEGISVNGVQLQLDPAIFSGGTLIDSGSTFTYLVAEAYDPLINSVNSVALKAATLSTSQGTPCYAFSTGLTTVFPKVRLNFANGAFLLLRPEDYLLERGSSNSTATWCLSLHRLPVLSVLGVGLMKDKLFVYDLEQNRIGMASYDCSTAINISVSPVPSCSSKDLQAKTFALLLVAALAVVITLMLGI